MELINATRMVAGYNFNADKDARDHLVVVIKGTFVLPVTDKEEVRLHDRQCPLVMADTYRGAPGETSTVYESDFALRKPRCDVLLNGTAYAEDGRPTKRMMVCMRIGPLVKSFDVVGERTWQAGARGLSASAPVPFATMPVSYDSAFGGTSEPIDASGHCFSYARNPVGRGWHPSRDGRCDGKPLPTTEAGNRPVKDAIASYEPLALGTLGRSWAPRIRYAGTYSDRWRQEEFPFLPSDFDERYFQAAPLEQQIPCPTSPLQVVLTGFTNDLTRCFVLPHFEAPVHLFFRRGGYQRFEAKVDTILFEPDEGRLSMTWRHTHPLQQDPHEIAQVVVGKKSQAWWRARAGGKAYYDSIARAIGKSETQVAPAHV